MKKRNGFVSNSSSSSFIIYYRGGKKDLRNNLEQIFELPTGYPIDLSTRKLVKCFMQDLEEVDLLEKANDYGWDKDDPDYLKLKSKLEKGFQVYEGSFSSDSGDGMESFLCEASIKYESDLLIIEKEGGY